MKNLRANMSLKAALAGHVCRLAAVLGLAGIAAGCGNSDAVTAKTVYPVKGKVLLKDGTPLKSGQVTLVSSEEAAEYSGPISADGTFEIQSSHGAGAPAGSYKVRIDPEAVLASGRKSAARAAASLPFPPKYTEESTSGLTATVKEGPNELEPYTLVAGSAADKKPSKGGRSSDQRE